MARAKRTGLGVDWCLPAKKGGGFAKRPFASTTVATADLVALLADDGLTWGQVSEATLYDADVRTVALGFIDAGHRDTPVSTHLNPRSTP